MSNIVERSGLMKKKIIATAFVIIFLVTLCVVVALWFNPNLNKFKLNSVEKNALEYIHQTYPEFTVDDISVTGITILPETIPADSDPPPITSPWSLMISPSVVFNQKDDSLRKVNLSDFTVAMMKYSPPCWAMLYFILQPSAANGRYVYPTVCAIALGIDNPSNTNIARICNNLIIFIVLVLNYCKDTNIIAKSVLIVK